MKNIKLALIIAAIFITVNASFGQSRIGGRVVEVFDGKTVSIEMQNGSRLTAVLQYIEVPEPDQPLHKIAAEHLSALVLDKKVEFRARSITPLKTAGSLYVNNVDIGQQMIRDGAAWYAILEKSGQEAAEGATYQNNEALAKSEKRGVWAFENLKPSWEIRAEAEENRRRQERIKLEEAAKMSASVGENQQPPKPVIKRQLNTESQMLSASASSVKLPSNIKMVSGLMVGYDPAIKIGLVATQMMKMGVTDNKGIQVITLQIIYLYYDGDENKGRQSKYSVFIESESDDFKFLKYNELIVTADNQKIIVGKARRSARKTEYGVKEGLEYEIKKSSLAKIANAGNLEIKVGTYHRILNGEAQTMIQNFFQTSL